MITTGNKGPWDKARRVPPEVLTPEEVFALMGTCSKRAPTGLRNQALIVVLWRAGAWAVIQRCS